MNQTGCRLCMNPVLEDPPHTIQDSSLKEQLAKVFTFKIEPREGLPHGVCQKCYRTVSEYYDFSEAVRRNQEQLFALQECEEDKKGNIKIEPTEFVLAQYGGEETQEVDHKDGLKEEASDNDFDFDDDSVSYQPTDSEMGGDTDEEAEYKNSNSGEDEAPEPKATRSKKKLVDAGSITSKSPKTAKPKEDTGIRVKPKNKYPSREEREANLKLIHEFFKMECHLCKIVTEDFPSLRTHFRDAHKQKAYIFCCKRKLDSFNIMLEHRNVHINPSAYKCDVCGKLYSGQFNLDQHKIKAHGNPNDRPFKCDQCTQSYFLKSQLKAHMSSHQKAQCLECGKMLSSKGALRAHHINMHSDVDRRKICDTCGQAFKDRFSYQRHVKEHMGIEVVKRAQCPLCLMWMRSERTLVQHMRHVHYERGQTFICNLCGKQSPNSKALDKHKKVVHVEMKYECEFCGAKFKQAVNLKEHRTIHTGEVLYSCQYCGVAKNSRANLYVHIKNVHSVEWAEKKRKAAEAKIPKPQPQV